MRQLNNDVNLSHAMMAEHIKRSSLSQTNSSVHLDLITTRAIKATKQQFCGATSMINKETSHHMIKK
jgi:hypothetical protein